MKSLLLILFSSLWLMTQPFNVLSCFCVNCPNSDVCQSKKQTKVVCTECTSTDCKNCNWFQVVEDCQCEICEKANSVKKKSLCDKKIQMILENDLLVGHASLLNLHENLTHQELQKYFDVMKKKNSEKYPSLVGKKLLDSAHKESGFESQLGFQCIGPEGEKFMINICFNVYLGYKQIGLCLEVISCECLNSTRQFKCTFKKGHSTINIPVNPREIIIYLNEKSNSTQTALKQKLVDKEGI